MEDQMEVQAKAAIEYLRGVLTPHTNIYAIRRNNPKHGRKMFSFFAIADGGTVLEDITARIAHALWKPLVNDPHIAIRLYGIHADYIATDLRVALWKNEKKPIYIEEI